MSGVLNVFALEREKSESVSSLVVSDSATPWTVAHQALLSMKFSRQEYWSGLPLSSPKVMLGEVIKDEWEHNTI